MTRKAKYNALAFLIFVIATASYFVLRCVYDPSIPYLQTTQAAQWILYRFPSVLHAIPSPQTAVFETGFDVGDVPENALLHINAFKAFRLWVNGISIEHRAIHPSNWKKTRTIDIQQYLRKGRNTVRVEVTCAYGPPALRLYSIGLKPGIRTDANWKVYAYRAPSMRLIVADAYPRHPIQARFPKPFPALVATLPMAIGIFSVFLILFGFLHRCRRHPSLSQLCTKLARSGPKIALLISIGAWIYFFVNNTPKIQTNIGFDAGEHLRYIRYLLDNHALPSAQASQSKIGQFHNPPLFYFMAAILSRVAALISSGSLSLYAMKFLPIVCGLGQILIAYRAAKYIFPDNSTAQTLAVGIAAVIPMNVYMSQYVSNETLCAFLMGLSLLMTLRIIGADHFVARHFYSLGAIVGLAVNAKITALTTLPIIILVLLMKIRSFDDKGRFRYYRHFAGAGAIIIGLTAWYFIRNYSIWGTPLVTNWEGSSGTPWWQEPGYTTAAYFLQFGKVFSLPFFSGWQSFFDSLYATFWGDALIGGMGKFKLRPPWNYEYMAATYLLSIPLSILILAGFLRALKHTIFNSDKSWFLMVGASILLFLAILHLNLRYPYYCHAKAFFGLSALLPACLFFSFGANLVEEHLLTRWKPYCTTVLYSYFCTVSVIIGLTYVVV